MFAGRRKELQETVTNWKKSPNLTRTGSSRSTNSRGPTQEYNVYNIFHIFQQYLFLILK